MAQPAQLVLMAAQRELLKTKVHTGLDALGWFVVTSGKAGRIVRLEKLAVPGGYGYRLRVKLDGAPALDTKAASWDAVSEALEFVWATHPGLLFMPELFWDNLELARFGQVVTIE
jgi:hypothetical protein